MCILLHDRSMETEILAQQILKVNLTQGHEVPMGRQVITKTILKRSALP